jgi:hypothetical protein
MPPFDQTEWTQYLVKIPTFILEQLIIDLESVHIQQATTTLHVNIHVVTIQLVYHNNVSFHQPIKVNPHSQLSGKRPRDLLGGGSHN